ncbi:hypothetical protein DL95DRAFT_409991 [Leptodontidium sp. 2 PMI_412]|nr:hypothetical protein DL95DRAFT_409991 [Leptodontidium sp. 2 PMI_412]
MAFLQLDFAFRGLSKSHYAPLIAPESVKYSSCTSQSLVPIAAKTASAGSLLQICMPDHRIWFCGWCRHGPHSLLLDEFCVNCYRRRDVSSTLESGNRINIQPDDHVRSEQPSHTGADRRRRRR